MRAMERRALVLLAVLVGSVALGPWGIALGAAPSDAVAETGEQRTAIAEASTQLNATADGSDSQNATITTTYTFSLPENPDDGVLVTATTPNVSAVEEFELSVEDYMTVVSSDGYDCGEHISGHTCKSTDDGPLSVTYRLNLSDMIETSRGNDWAVLRAESGQANIGMLHKTGKEIDKVRDIRLPGEGRVFNNQIIVLGDHRVYERRVDGQTLQVVVPGNLSTRAPPETILDAMEKASRSLASEDARATGIVTRFLPWEEASTLDDRTFLMGADDPISTWLHEYVHTQQEFSHAESMEWYVEGSAEYYSQQIAVTYGYTPWGSFDKMLSRASGDRSVLSQPNTWRKYANYFKGAAVIATLDRQIRSATEGKATFQNVWNKLQNAEDLNVSQFRTTLRSVGNDSVASTAQKYVQTDAVVPSDWSKSAYERAYGIDPAVMGIEHVHVTANGPLGEHRVALKNQQGNLVVGETVTITYEATNTGGQTGLVSLSPRIYGPNISKNTIDPWVEWLSPGESATTTVQFQVDEPGAYDIDAWSASGEVLCLSLNVIQSNVSRPSVSITNGTVAPGETVTVDVVVDNATAASLNDIPSSWTIASTENASANAQTITTAAGEKKVRWSWQGTGNANVSATLRVPANASAGVTELTAIADGEQQNATATATIQVTDSTNEQSTAELVDSDDDGQIGNVEILNAIGSWRTNEPIAGTDRQVGNLEILNLIELWRTNAQV